MARDRLGVAGVALTLCLAVGSPAHALTFTCSTVVRRGLADPAGALFGNRFNSPGINVQGDVVFFAKAARAPRRLYLYPSAGTPSIVAAAGDVAPGGAVFRRFGSPSINDLGDLGFFGDLDDGEGVFVRPAAGSIAKAALKGDAAPAPGGGFFQSFPDVSRVNADGDIAFIGRVSGGPNGVFVYDASAATVAAVAVEGDTTLEGRKVCELLAVGLGGTAVVVRAMTKLDCADNSEPDLIGIYRQVAGGLSAVAEQDGTTPIPGSIYTEFVGAPDANAANRVLFRARATVGGGGTGLFLFDPVGPTTSVLAVTGDAAPGAGGSLQTVAPGGLTDGDRVGIGARIAGGTARTGVFLFGGVPEAVVLDTDPVPTDLFGPNSQYTKINPGNRKTDEEIGVDRSGTQLTYIAKVRDTLGLLGKAGIFRCAGS